MAVIQMLLSDSEADRVLRMAGVNVEALAEMAEESKEGKQLYESMRKSAKRVAGKPTFPVMDDFGLGHERMAVINASSYIIKTAVMRAN